MSIVVGDRGSRPGQPVTCAFLSVERQRVCGFVHVDGVAWMRGGGEWILRERVSGY